MGVDFGDKQYGLQRGPKVAWSTGVEKVLEHTCDKPTNGDKSVPKSHAVLRGLKQYTSQTPSASRHRLATFD